jgi:DNA polymerase III sliding clamp (beta) subunit (PCNA family)
VVSPGGVVDWTFQVPISGAFGVVTTETLRIGVSFTYFKNMLHALEIQDCEEMVLEFRGAHKGIVFLTSEHSDWTGVVMPLRLAGVDKVK